ncbi:MAG: hypothetical protein HOO06_03835 [Bdellovibrionaceae bacterium]|jgi:hypothetical protein|nr:hypothetical protein [Pseudobdellovibrionaceae bacterium]
MKLTIKKCVLTAMLTSLPLTSVYADGPVKKVKDSVVRGSKSIWNSADFSASGSLYYGDEDGGWDSLDDKLQVRRVRLEGNAKVSERWQIRGVIRLDDGNLADVLDNIEEDNVETFVFNVDLSNPSAGPGGLRLSSVQLGKHKIAFHAGAQVSPMSDYDSSYNQVMEVSNEKIGATISAALGNVQASLSAFKGENNVVSEIFDDLDTMDSIAASIQGTMNGINWQASMLDDNDLEGLSLSVNRSFGEYKVSMSSLTIDNNGSETSTTSIGVKRGDTYAKLVNEDADGQESKESLILGTNLLKTRHCSLNAELEASEDASQARAQMECKID